MLGNRLGTVGLQSGRLPTKPLFSALRMTASKDGASVELLDSQHPQWQANQVVLNGQLIGFSKNVKEASEKLTQQGKAPDPDWFRRTLRGLLREFLTRPQFPGAARKRIDYAMGWGHFKAVPNGYSIDGGTWSTASASDKAR